MIHRIHKLGPQNALLGVEMATWLRRHCAVDADVEDTAKLLAVLTLKQRPGGLSRALDAISGVLVHPCALLLNQDLLAGTDELQALLLQARQGLVELLFGLDAAREVAGSGDPDDAVTVDDSKHCLDRGR